MPVCGKCGSEVAENMRFCTNCGTPVNSDKTAVRPDAVKKQPAEPSFVNGASSDDKSGVNASGNVAEIKPVGISSGGNESNAVPISAAAMSADKAAPSLDSQYITPDILQKSARQPPAYECIYIDENTRSPSLPPLPELSAWKCFATFFLITLPVAGPIIFLVWLFGGSKYRSRVAMIRGLLIYFVVSLLISGLLCFAFHGVLVSVGERVFDKLNEASGNVYADKGVGSFDELIFDEDFWSSFTD